jgi:hypothetical protein
MEKISKTKRSTYPLPYEVFSGSERPVSRQVQVTVKEREEVSDWRGNLGDEKTGSQRSHLGMT